MAWPSILARLSKSSEWRCIAYLIFGAYLDKTGARKRHNGKHLWKLLMSSVITATDVLWIYNGKMAELFKCLNNHALSLVIMPPASKKLEGYIASGLFIRPSVRPFVALFDA